MISRAIHWLTTHRIANVLLLIGYILFIILAHPWFVDRSVEVMQSLSIPVYNTVVAAVMLLFFIGSGLLLGSFVKRIGRNNTMFFYLLFSSLLLLVHFFALTEMNIEFIHAIMYGLLALLFYPLVGRFGGAVIYGLPVMLVDEWYQYVILFPDYTHYFEFNDMLLDILGAGLFIAILGLILEKPAQIAKPFFKRSETWLLLALMAIITGMMATGIIVPYTEQSVDSTWLVLNRLPPMTEFWYVHPTIGSTLHVLRPWTGIIAMFVLAASYLGMERQN